MTKEQATEYFSEWIIPGIEPTKVNILFHWNDFLSILVKLNHISETEKESWLYE